MRNVNKFGIVEISKDGGFHYLPCGRWEAYCNEPSNLFIDVRE